MLVEEIMNQNVQYLTKTDTIEDAIHTMNQYRIRHIPIVDKEKKLIGIVSDRDVRDASPSIFHAEEHLEDFKKPLKEIMVYPVVTAHPLDFVEEVASVLYEHDISALPIAADDDTLVGMITETDILHTLVKLTGAHQPSSQIEIQVHNVAGQLADVAGIFKERGVNVTSVLVYPHTNPEYKILVFRLQLMDPREVINVLKEEGYHIKWPTGPEVHP
ncbi:acetoin utilization AcuB family protein [Salsuginibacillus kocurii]|uniref:acetoin utilization AcuB family protein n=1 Tax=Salsuginibacillus kocurii TaxID=427078 RepID=UPI000376FEE2|nr:acetoin utilization AcuB family protein [Salsuginibacillus kocurii]